MGLHMSTKNPNHIKSYKNMNFFKKKLGSREGLVRKTFDTFNYSKHLPTKNIVKWCYQQVKNGKKLYFIPQTKENLLNFELLIKIGMTKTNDPEENAAKVMDSPQ